jgi:hypothetical protein
MKKLLFALCVIVHLSNGSNLVFERGEKFECGIGHMYVYDNRGWPIAGFPLRNFLYVTKCNEIVKVKK